MIKQGNFLLYAAGSLGLSLSVIVSNVYPLLNQNSQDKRHDNAYVRNYPPNLSRNSEQTKKRADSIRPSISQRRESPSIKILSAQYFAWSRPTMMNHGLQKDFATKFCSEQKYMGSRIEVEVPRLSQPSLLSCRIQIKDDNGNLLEAIKETFKIRSNNRPGIRYLFPSSVFHIGSIEVYEGSHKPLILEVLVKDEVVSTQRILLTRCSQAQIPTVNTSSPDEEEEVVSLSDDECLTRKTGTFCFKNISRQNILVVIPEYVPRPGGWQLSMNSEQLELEAGAVGCVFDKPTGPIRFTIYDKEKQGSERVNLREVTGHVETCKSSIYIYP